MAHEIICEDFDITPAIKNAVEGNLVLIQKHLPNDSVVHVFVSEPGKKKFEVVYKVCLWRKDIVAHAQGVDLYALLDKVRKTFVQNIINHRKKMTSKTA